MNKTKESPRINLTIEASGGGSIEEQYNPNQPIKAVKTSAMAKLHLDPNTADNYAIYIKGETQPLPENKSLEDADVQDGSTLVIIPISAEVI